MCLPTRVHQRTHLHIRVRKHKHLKVIAYS